MADGDQGHSSQQIIVMLGAETILPSIVNTSHESKGGVAATCPPEDLTGEPGTYRMP